MTRKPDADKDLTYSDISYGKALIRSSKFEISTHFQPRGNQAAAIESLVRGVKEGEKHQVLLGVTGIRQDVYHGQDDRGVAAPGSDIGSQ